MASLMEFISKLTRNPGLIFGEEATIQGTRAELEAAVGAVTSRPISLPDLPTLLDELSEKDQIERQKIEDSWKEYLKKANRSLDLPHLAKAGWSACVSATKDMLFEGELTSHLESIPASKTITVVDGPEVRVPPRSIPVYKLYGNLNATDPARSLVLSTSDTFIRRESWSVLLRDLPDKLKGAPVVFIGVPADVTKFVLSSLIARPHPRVREIFYIEEDPTFKDPTVRSLCSSFSAEPINATYRDLCNAVSELKVHRTRQIYRPEVDNFARTYSSIVSVVPGGNATLEFEPHRNALIDALFRPKSADWAPYQLNLDLRRTLADDICDSIRNALEEAHQRPRTIFIRGEAAVGKTVTAKHVAVKLAQEGIFVAWSRTAPYNWMSLFREMFNNLRGPEKVKQVAIFCDDPHSLKVNPSEILSGLEELNVPSVIVVVNRNTDYFGSDSGAAKLSLSASIEVPVELNEQETDQLPSFLHHLGIVESEDQGRGLVGSIGTRAASDILCSLWYLVPATKSQIADSLRDQYIRLGESEATIQSVAKSAASTNYVAKRAYEFVTVSSSLNIGLPVEVLVRALKIDYQDWIDMCVLGRPLWGLLYDEESDDGDTIEYWTRNEVVTQVLLDLLNGGTGNAGQMRALGSLIEVCSDGSAVYRDFVTDVLVRSRRTLENGLTYRQGMELYALAEVALGSDDRTLKFHKGIWMQHKGTDRSSAYAQLNRALGLPQLSEAGQYAPDEHIHTSMAATVLEMIRNGDLDQFKGIAQIREHLKHATSPTFINPHSAHVTARMFFDIARNRSLASNEDLRAECLAQALSEIEKALQLIGSDGKSRIRDASSIEYLRELQSDILQFMPNEDELEQLAARLLETAENQVGYVALVRRAVAFASERNKGTDYNHANQWIERVESKVIEAGFEIDLEIVAARVDLMVRWRLQRTGGPVDWEKLQKDLDRLLSQPAYQESIVKNFLSAVVYFHLGDTTLSSAKFATLRRLNMARHTQRAMRAYYLNKEGQPLRVQFTLVRHSGRLYLESSDLGIDIPVNRTPRNIRPGDTTHAYIGFSLLGPTAVFDRPTNERMLLP